MAKTLSAFINNIKSMVNLGLYVWGANGELLSSKKDPEQWIRDMETSDSNAEKTIKLYRKRKDKAVRAMDCSGLIVYSLRATGAKSKTFDTSAEGFRSKYCTEISKGELRNGDLCFKMSGGEAVHVGMYLGGKVIESRGRAYGVVSRSLAMGGWKKYGRLMINWDDEPEQYVLTRLLKKGCKGSDVKELQSALIKLGYSVGRTGVDGDFGNRTKNAVRELQLNSCIKVDGIVGKNTCEVLGWIWQG